MKLSKNILKEVSVLMIILLMFFSSTMAIRNIDYNHTSILIDYEQNPTLDVNQIFTSEKQGKLGIIDEEDFEGSLPPGWAQVKYGSSTGEWIREYYYKPGEIPYTPYCALPPASNDYFADADSFHEPLVYDVSLFTNAYDLSTCFNCIVTLEYYYVFMQWGPDIARVSTYSGSTYEETLVDYTNSIPSGSYFCGDREVLTFDVCSYTDPSEVYIEFYYSSGLTTGSGKFAIDDFRLYCCQATIDIPHNSGFNIPVTATITSIPPPNPGLNWNIGWTALPGGWGVLPIDGTGNGFIPTPQQSNTVTSFDFQGPGVGVGIRNIDIVVSADCATPVHEDAVVICIGTWAIVFI